jgi:hypothetical protein
MPVLPKSSSAFPGTGRTVKQLRQKVFTTDFFAAAEIVFVFAIALLAMALIYSLFPNLIVAESLAFARAEAGCGGTGQYNQHFVYSDVSDNPFCSWAACNNEL